MFTLKQSPSVYNDQTASCSSSERINHKQAIIMQIIKKNHPSFKTKQDKKTKLSEFSSVHFTLSTPGESPPRESTPIEGK